MTSDRPRRGRLTEEDRRLWTHVTRDVRPRLAARPVVLTDIAPASAPEPPPAPARKLKAKPAPPPASKSVPVSHGGLDGRRDERFRKGQLEIEARIDLHGFTLDHAHAVLTDFLLESRRRGHRMVLVITGKGSAGGEGAIKRFTPRWLAEPPYAGMIAATAQARPQHGGGGALYVYLRRKRA